MRRLLSFLKPYQLQVAWAVALLFLASVSQLAGPLLIKIGIDTYISNGDTQGLVFIGLVYLLALGLEFVLQFLQTYWVNWIGQYAMYDMRMRTFSHIQRLPVRYFDRHPVGRLVTRVTTDIASLHQMLSSGAVAIFGDIFKLVGIVVMLLVLNWKLALVTFSVLPLLFYATFLFKQLVRGIYRQIRIRIARINSFLQENISGVAVVQLFGREQTNFTKFEQLNRDYLNDFLRTILYYATFYPVVRLISAVAVALIVWYGGGHIIRGVLSFGALVAFIQYAEMFLRPIMDLSEKYNIMQSAMASSERIFKLLDEPQETVRPSQRAVARVAGDIEFDHVWFAYNDDDFVLKDISFRIKPGEKIAFVGATGSGKTTLMNLLLRFYEVSRGEIRVDGVNLKNMDTQHLRESFGMVLQDVFIFDGSIARNIRLQNAEISDEQVLQAATDVNAISFIRKFPDMFEQGVLERGKGLSVGQRQLVSFARALAFDPPVLILDEATSSVDTETELLIQDALERLMQNRTALVVAHRLSTVQNADRIIVLHKGEIREVGTHQELLAAEGIYYRLYKLQYAYQEKKHVA